ncbi:MAG: hypothetical protein AAF127_05645 [Pseudomonadota bacterium]
MKPARTAFTLATAITAGTLALATPSTAQDEALPPLPELPPVAPPPITPVVTDAPLPTLPMPAAPMAETAMPQTEVSTLPPEYQQLPIGGTTETTTVGADGVETVTRTRRIAARAPAAPVANAPVPQGYPVPAYAYGQPTYAPQPVYGQMAPAPAAAVFDRETWLAECRRRTTGRSEKEKGGIIGGLLGAIGGGILGNRIADAERLGGTLIGAGVGGLAGLVLGNLIGGGKKKDRYDCEAALDGYMTQYGPLPVSTGYPAYPHGYAQPAYGYATAPCNCGPAYQTRQMTYVPVQYQQRQRVIVRETVREEMVPGATRIIPPAPQPVPLPSPKLIKQAPAPVASPKMIKNGF